MITKYLTEIYNKENIKGYFYRNKYYILFVLIIFILSLIAGYVFEDLFKQMMIDVIKDLASNVPDTTSELTVMIFLNNLKVAIIIILLGLLFSIFSLAVLFFNGVVIGFMFNIVPAPLMLLYITPHGIFEIPQLLLAVVCSLLVTKLEINLIKGTLQNNKTFIGEFKNSSQIIKDIILSFTIILALLIVAAVIEGYITPSLAAYLSSVFNLTF